MSKKEQRELLPSNIIYKPGRGNASYREVEIGGDVVKKDRGKDSTSQLRAALLLTAISIVLTICVLVIAVIILVSKGHHQTNEEPTSSIACVKCSDLSLGLLDDVTTDPLLRKLRRKMEDKTEYCCAYNSAEMSAMFEAVLRRQESPEEPLPSYNVSDFKFSPVSAHKIIYPERFSQELGDIHIPQQRQICHFKRRDNQHLEHHRGVDILNKGIKIRHAGLYYIYSSVEFRPQSTWPCKQFDFQMFTHSVWLRNRFGQSQLLKTTHTCCDDCINNQESRFTGGVFRLEQGDVIQVKVMEYRLVQFMPESSFAGLAMMGGLGDEEVDDARPWD